MPTQCSSVQEVTHERNGTQLPDRSICGKDYAWNGQKLQEGDFVALLDGDIVAVTHTADDAIAALRTRDQIPKGGWLYLCPTRSSTPFAKCHISMLDFASIGNEGIA